MSACGLFRVPGFSPGIARGRFLPILTVPELADPLAEALAQPLVPVNPMAAGVADLQGMLWINLSHGFESVPLKI